MGEGIDINEKRKWKNFAADVGLSLKAVAFKLKKTSFTFYNLFQINNLLKARQY